MSYVDELTPRIGQQTATSWPAAPYRRLDFYEEAHAALFRERDGEVSECLRLLSTYNVKILLLHGSSGAGKSSFLRAGLVPALKQMQGRRRAPTAQAVFLNATQGVIRSTSDPTNAIAEATLSALHEQKVFLFWELATEPNEPAVSGPDETLLARLRTQIKSAQAVVVSVKGDKKLTEAYNKLAKTIVDVLAELCLCLNSGKIYLIIDQAEEALTRTTGNQQTNPEASAFFYFLEQVYVRNLAMRLIVSLRTEYYGRFREELRIEDSRLGKRPDEGGLEPFLLRPLKDQATLIRAFEYPTLAKETETEPVYPFSYAEGVLAKVVTDVLERRELINASVTPLISMACAFLYERLPGGQGVIGQSDYPGIEAILNDYVRRGVKEITQRGLKEENRRLELLRKIENRWLQLLRKIEPVLSNRMQRKAQEIAQPGFKKENRWLQLLRKTDATLSDYVLHAVKKVTQPGLKEENRWLELLHNTLVSRQGGGTVVSLTEDADAFRRQAAADKLDLPDDHIYPSLVQLTGGPTPLLRGEPANQPVRFSLKHDALAVRLDRWHLEHKGEVEQQRRMMRKVGIAAAVVAGMMVVLAAWTYQSAKARAQLEVDAANKLSVSSELRAYIASDAEASDFERSLLLLLLNIRLNESAITDAKRDGNKAARNISSKALQASVSALREALTRTPWFTGVYWGVGFDPAQKKLALLRLQPERGVPDHAGHNYELVVFSLTEAEASNHSLELASSTPEIYPMPDDWAPSQEQSDLTVGFLNSLGPTVYRTGILYYWPKPGQQPKTIDFHENSAAGEMFHDWAPFPEFNGGSLFLKRPLSLGGFAGQWKILRFDLDVQKESPVQQIPISIDLQTTGLAQRTIFSDVHNLIYFAALRIDNRVPPFRCDDAKSVNKTCTLPRLDPQNAAEEFSAVTLEYGLRSEGEVKPVPIAIEHSVRLGDQSSPYTYAFAEETNTFAVLGGGGAILLKDLTISGDPVQIQVQQEEFPLGAPEDRKRALELLDPPGFWMRPLFAISRYNDGWILAWDAADGFWTASVHDNSTYATPMLNGTLMSGEPGGRVLKFTSDGSELVLLQQPRWGGPITVKVWDLRKEWLGWIEDEQKGPNEKELVKLACGLIKGSGYSRGWQRLEQIYRTQNQAPPCE
jgi:hypothetical protein